MAIPTAEDVALRSVQNASEENPNACKLFARKGDSTPTRQSELIFLLIRDDEDISLVFRHDHMTHVLVIDELSLVYLLRGNRK